MAFLIIIFSWYALDRLVQCRIKLFAVSLDFFNAVVLQGSDQAFQGHFDPLLQLSGSLVVGLDLQSPFQVVHAGQDILAQTLGLVLDQVGSFLACLLYTSDAADDL